MFELFQSEPPEDYEPIASASVLGVFETKARWIAEYLGAADDIAALEADPIGFAVDALTIETPYSELARSLFPGVAELADKIERAERLASLCPETHSPRSLN